MKTIWLVVLVVGLVTLVATVATIAIVYSDDDDENESENGNDKELAQIDLSERPGFPALKFNSNDDSTCRDNLSEIYENVLGVYDSSLERQAKLDGSYQDILDR